MDKQSPFVNLLHIKVIKTHKIINISVVEIFVAALVILNKIKTEYFEISAANLDVCKHKCVNIYQLFEPK